jgi:hypothetical protein
MAQSRDIPPMEEPLAELERLIIDDYVRGAGHDPATIHSQHDEASRKLLASAVGFAAGRLAEVECRSHYLRKLHGQE